MSENGFLSDIVINKFYNELNEKYGNSEVSNFCNIIIRSNFNNISDDSRKYCYSIDSILKNQDKILESIGKDKNKDKFCLYLNYWIRDKLKDNEFRYRIIKYVYSAWDMINKSNGTSNSKCWHKKFNVGEKDFKNKKKWFEFFEAFDIIKEKMKKTENSKKNEYCNYLQSIFSLYYVKKQESICNKSSFYKEEIGKFESKINDDVFSLLKEKCPGSNLEFLYKINSDRELPNRQGLGVTRLENNDTPYTKVMEEILGKLTSHTIYTDLDNKQDIDKYCNYCINVLPLEKDYPGVTEFCKLLSKNLSNIKDKNDRDERCPYLSYWTYDNVRKIIRSSTYNTLNPVINQINNLILLINMKFLNKSLCLFYLDSSANAWKEEKYLHEYFKYFTDIEGKSGIPEKDQKTYCEFIRNINKLYESHINHCCNYFTEDAYFSYCNKYFNCDKKYNPYVLYSKLNCTNVLPPEAVFKKVEQPVAIDYYVKYITEKSKERAQMLKKMGVAYFNMIHAKTDNILGDPFHMATLSVLILLGIFIIYFVFYKCSASGSSSRKKEMKKNNNKLNYHEYDRKKLPENDSEIGNINSGRKRARIAYHPG
ncbi:VIR protein [Plasmodium vivax]|uniref:VIR protein n=1 Tax=Plasmodium vivax TaxID=5855 RepID=A0A1G4E691_PLAVI|nr:VIR protein [Plasmodium vivax]